jgi:hypothetical protein
MSVAKMRGSKKSPVLQLNQKEWKGNGPKHTKMILGNKQAKIIRDLNTTLINKRGYRNAVHIITGHSGLNNGLAPASPKKKEKKRKKRSHHIPQCVTAVFLMRRTNIIIDS